MTRMPITQIATTRISMLVLSLLLITGITASSALAAITFHRGPEARLSGDTVTVTANMSGLGNTPATGNLTLSGFATYTCVNPGGNTAPGQDQVTATSPTASQQLSTAKNGRATLNLSQTLTAPATVDPQAAGCPNGNWRTRLQDVTVTSALLTIVQGGTEIYRDTFTF